MVGSIKLQHVICKRWGREMGAWLPVFSACFSRPLGGPHEPRYKKMVMEYCPHHRPNISRMSTTSTIFQTALSIWDLIHRLRGGIKACKCAAHGISRYDPDVGRFYGPDNNLVLMEACCGASICCTATTISHAESKFGCTKVPHATITMLVEFRSRNFWG